VTRDEVKAWLEARVRDGEHGCLIWTMSINGAGHPIASVEGKRSRAVRPWLFGKLVRQPDPGMRLVPTCRDLRCLNVRQHCAELLPGQVNELLVAEGRWNTPKRLAANVRNGLLCSNYSEDQIAAARRLRNEGQVLKKIAESTGIHLSTVSRVCRGERRRDQVVPGSSVFSWRGGA
jgi:hypothetical protein